MAQQPNIVRKGVESLAPVAKPPSWTPTRAGEITKPQEAVTGPGFGVQGPDTGYAYRLVRIAEFDRCGRGEILEEVLVTLMGARAGKLRRAPAKGDLEVAKEILGIGDVRSAAKRRLQVYDECDSQPRKISIDSGCGFLPLLSSCELPT
jgi:hypothetical protein